MNLHPFKLERYFARYEFTSEYLLSSSDCESLTVRELLDLEPAAREEYERLRLGYTESQGSPSLREQISRIYSTIQPGDVLVHAGAEEAIFVFMSAALRSGDHIIVHSPCYESLAEVARGLGCEVTSWDGKEQDSWSLDPDQLRSALRPGTRVIVLNTPHNPTGYQMQRDDFLSVCRIAEEHDIILFSDEVYRESEYDIRDRLPAACDVSKSAVSLGSTSKTYGLPGLRIGWIATHNRDLLTSMAHLKDYTSICCSAPGEFFTELALRHREALIKRNVDILSHNLSILDAFFARHRDRLSWVRPGSGPVAFPRLIVGDIEEFCRQLVTRSSVLLLPGSVYDDRENHFRIGFGRANLPNALSRLDEFLQSWTG